LLRSIFVFVINKKPPANKETVINWAKPKQKPVPAKFNISSSGSYPAEIKEIGYITKKADLIINYYRYSCKNK